MHREKVLIKIHRYRASNFPIVLFLVELWVVRLVTTLLKEFPGLSLEC